MNSISFAEMILDDMWVFLHTAIYYPDHTTSWVKTSWFDLKLHAIYAWFLAILRVWSRLYSAPSFISSKLFYNYSQNTPITKNSGRILLKRNIISKAYQGRNDERNNSSPLVEQIIFRRFNFTYEGRRIFDYNRAVK